MRVPNHIVELAIKVAKESTHRFRVGAVIYDKDNVLGYGFNNHLKTHPKSPHPFKTRHAEFDALVYALSRNWEDNIARASIYVHRLKADDSPGMAKPCRYCDWMLNQIQIKKRYWSEG